MQFHMILHLMSRLRSKEEEGYMLQMPETNTPDAMAHERLPFSQVTLFPQSRLADVNAYRSAMRMLMGSVTVVLSHGDKGIHGMTASAICSVSVDPPLLLVCVNRTNRSKDYIAASKQLSLNILSEDQAHISEHFASADKSALPQIGMVDCHAVIEGAIACFVCDVQHCVDAGSHTIFVCSVRDVRTHGGEPLGYFNGAYRTSKSGGITS
jgi:flavin reductase